MGFLDKIFGNATSRGLKEAAPVLVKIKSFEEGFKKLSDDELKAKTAFFKGELAGGKTLEDILPEAFAVVKEASRRTLGISHFDVQLIGGIMLHRGRIAEMRTGEGKTLVATLPLYLNALEGKGVHLVTVNDYLSRRDAVWMGQIYAFLGLSVGVVNGDASYLYDPTHSELDKNRDQVASFKVLYEFLRPCQRNEAYNADITYGTNNEYGFDYLRDNISYRTNDLRQREFHFAIVDEIDSILIDEARTPLIISAPSNEKENLYSVFTNIASKLQLGEDFEVDEKLRAITLKDAGIEKAEKALGVENIYTEKGIKYVHHLETAVRAKALFHKDKEYVVRDGEVVIVDEFTGRMQPGRRWSEGLHQAIEAKEGVEIKEETRTYASITFQNYFRLYKKLSGMTGTAKTSSEEFHKVYGLDTIEIPTHHKIARKDHDDLIFQTEEGKFKAIGRKVRELYEKGQPVLIGTVLIEKNELLSAYLKREGVPHQILNAKNHEKEGEIISQAGKKGAVTIATNMAGRGVDIKLGGAPVAKELEEEIKNVGGLFVLGTERHEARRIDNQLRGRSGRQGDPGETQFFVSLDDNLMRVFAGDTIKKMMGRLGIAEDEPIKNGLITRSLETAQKRIEGFHFDSRKHVLEFDDVLNYQRKIVYERRREVLVGNNESVIDSLHRIVGEDGDAIKIIEEKRKAVGDEAFGNIARGLILQTTDMFWMDHLETMDYLRSSVNLRAYGQRDPLVEYKKEGLRLFKDMQNSIAQTIIENLPQINAPLKVDAPKATVAIHPVANESGGQAKETSSAQVVNDENKVGRNDLCSCGSGKKYKKCHGK